MVRRRIVAVGVDNAIGTGTRHVHLLLGFTLQNGRQMI